MPQLFKSRVRVKLATWSVAINLTLAGRPFFIIR